MLRYAKEIVTRNTPRGWAHLLQGCYFGKPVFEEVGADLDQALCTGKCSANRPNKPAFCQTE